MAIRHTISVRDKETGDIVLRDYFLGNGIFADDTFYENLKISYDEDGYSDRVEVKLNDFFREFVLYVRRKFRDEALIDLGKDLDDFAKDNKTCSILLLYRNQVYVQIFRLYEKLLPYVKEYGFEEMKDEYALEVELG